MTDTTGTPALHLAGLSKHFGAVTAVDGIDLTVGRGEVVAFLGPNGAGKTSTIDMVLGLSTPTAGTVEVLGLNPHDAVGHGLVAAVMQSGGLLKDLTVAETVELTASLFRSPRPAREVLERASLTHLADRRVGLCSGGEQQRLRFALSLLPDPELLVLDEPTTGMDVESRRAFWAAIRQDTGRGRTVVFATHYLDEADAYADRIVLVRHGRIVAEGTPAQLKAMSSGRTIRATLHGADQSRLAGLPGVTSVEVRGETVILQTRDSDAVLRRLLTETTAHDVEVTSRNLEDAFVALTSDTPDDAAALTAPPATATTTTGSLR
jgi:ABC-2 type transport system ATP-binding protein